MTSRRWKSPALLCALISMGGASASAGQGLSPNECRRVAFSTPLVWATSGAWSADGETLLVVDALQEQILQVSPRGEVTPALVGELVAAAGGPSPELRRPSKIRAVDGGYLLEDEWSDQIYRLNPHLEWVHSTNVKGQQVGADLTLEAIYDWSPMGAGILSFGDLEGPAQSWHAAFLYFADGGEAQVFDRVPTMAPVVNHYVRDMPYIATLGEVGYILFMDRKPAIGEVRLGSDRVRRLDSVPEDFRNRPLLKTRPEWAQTGQGARQATHFFKTIEGSTMAAGLYAQDRYLYLLAKEAATDNGETAWWLIKLDPKDDAREVARIPLPTAAAHLTVVPGQFWAFIEKGPVQGIGETHAPYMETASMVLVPAAWLGEPYSSPLGTELGAQCASLSPNAGSAATVGTLSRW